jgi:hypothetical protein
LVKNSFFSGNDLALSIAQNTSVVDNVIEANGVGILPLSITKINLSFNHII